MVDWGLVGGLFVVGAVLFCFCFIFGRCWFGKMFGEARSALPQNGRDLLFVSEKSRLLETFFLI